MKEYRFYGWETADIKDTNGLTPRDYYDILSDIWCADTCAPRMRDNWSVHNPTLGQCSITAFLMQDLFGGKVYGILRPGGNYHCFNVVEGCVFDLTSEQFGDEVLDYSNCPEQFRETHFAKEEKRMRYEYLRAQLLKKHPFQIKTIGVDIGTTTISLAVYEAEKDTVTKAVTIPNGCFVKDRPEWEKIQDVPVIVTRAKEALDQLLDQYPEISAIGLTGQMHGIVYVNEAGEAISPLYTWQDQRASLPEFDGKSIVEQIRNICGISVPAGYGLATHCYQANKNLVPENAAFLCTIPDYLGMVLTERKTPLIHTSMAASLGFFDSENGVFRKEALDAMGVDTKILPEVTGDVSLLGYYRGIPVTAALGDSQASFLGTAGLAENTVLLNMGTGGQVSVLSKQYFQMPGIEARPFLQGKYLLTGSSLCGGRAYAILEHFFREYAVAAGAPDQPQYEKMEELAETAAFADNRMRVVTAFHGTRVDPDARGSISGLSEDNFTPGGLILGVLTGMAEELFDLYAGICEGTGVRAERVVASGNGLRKNRMLRQIFQDMFQSELELSRHEEEAACGAAMSGGMWMGR